MKVNIMKTFYLNLIFFICHAEAELGFLQIKGSPNADPIEICVAYNRDIKSFPVNTSLTPWHQWPQVVDLYPSYECTYKNMNYSGKYVFLKRGNCTFATKALTIQRANGLGAIIVSNDGIFSPSIDPKLNQSINITLALITEKSYKVFLKEQQQYGSVRVAEYAPLKPKLDFDPSSVLMWCIAVLTLSYGAWQQGVLKLLEYSHDTDHSKTKHTPAKKGKSQDFQVTPTVAVIFFFMCSMSLLLMYFFYDYIVYFIIGIFCYASSYALFDVLYFKLSKTCFSRYRLPPNSLPFLKTRPLIIGCFLYIACVLFSIFWLLNRKASFAWIFQDILGSAFCIYMIKTIGLPNFKVSTVLLLLFFVYDVFYVFVTPLLTKNKESIMVQVATGGGGKSNEELPMLFKLPKFFAFSTNKCSERSYSLLGYGDVILPGLHVGFCAVWDVMSDCNNTIKRHTYYIASLIGYSLGLTLTLVAVYAMKIGQPALLYLVPCCLISTLLVALKRKELNNIWSGKQVDLLPTSIAQAPRLDESHTLLETHP